MNNLTQKAIERARANMEAERGFLGCVLFAGNEVNPGYFKITTSFFGDNRHKSLWTAIKSAIPKISGDKDLMQCLAGELRESNPEGLTPDDIADILANTHTAIGIGSFYDELIEHYYKRRISDAGSVKAMEKLLEEKKNYVVKNNSSLDVFEKISETKLEGTMQVDMNPLTWNIECIDKCMGRPVPGTFYVLAGQPGVGKSIIATDMALANNEYAYTAVFSLEMEKIDFLKDYIHVKIGKKRDDIMLKNYSPDDVRKARSWEDKINTSTTSFIDDTGMTENGVKVCVEEIIRLCDDNGVTMVFIDSLSKLRANSDKSHVNEAIVVDLLSKWRNKRMDEDNPITIILIHHLSKDSMSVAGSKKIEEDCGGMIKLRSTNPTEGIITWETGKLRKNRYCKIDLQQKDGGLVEASFQS